jgi:hypothetical protein
MENIKNRINTCCRCEWPITKFDVAVWIAHEGIILCSECCEDVGIDKVGNSVTRVEKDAKVVYVVM